MLIKKGLCQCGCGQQTAIAKQNLSHLGHTKGQPVKFICGHHLIQKGSNNPRWKGGRYLSCGYVYILKPNHPQACLNGYVREHLLVAEEVLGKPLPEGAVVHHVNENRSDNRKENLVICENRAYHNLLHQRMRALKDCGHVNWRKCIYCKEYDNTDNLSIISQNRAYHKKCAREYGKQLKICNERKEVQNDELDR